ncbi:uncharacterized protein [Drosophila takahashii]|uniref:uncharacterized protein n=1 Tax=Drosophila takahashii TaxID=29030 RepID=UPI001CF820C8|nr:uncharacterized protein LOC108062978 [Drosophila takahashii]
MAVYSNRCLVQEETSTSNENLARVAASSVEKSLGPAGRWLALTGAYPQPTFPITTAICDTYYCEGTSLASFTSSSPRSSDSVIFPEGRPMFLPILQFCNSLMHKHSSDVKTLAEAQAFQASLKTVRDTVARLTSETASNFRNDSNDSVLYWRLVSLLVVLDRIKNEVQHEIDMLDELEELH